MPVLVTPPRETRTCGRGCPASEPMSLGILTSERVRASWELLLVLLEGTYLDGVLESTVLKSRGGGGFGGGRAIPNCEFGQPIRQIVGFN